MKLYEGEYRVYMVNFHCGAIKAAVREDEEGYPSIYINDDCSPETKKKALAHELKHITNNDLSNGRPIKEVEQCRGKRSNI